MFPHLKSHSSVLSQSLKIGLVAVFNAALALLMTWYVVVRLSVSQETDAFFASGALPQFVFLVVGATLLPVLVPLLATSEHDFRENAWSFFSLTLLFFLLLAALLYITSTIWVPLVVPGFSASGKALTISLTRIQLLSMVLNAAIVTLWAAHHARQRFLWVECSSAIANLAGLVFLILSLQKFGVGAAAWNTVFYNSLKLLFLLPILGPWVRPHWRLSAVKEAWRRLKPLLPGHVYLRTDPLVDRFLTSMTGPGTLSTFFIAQQAYASAVLLLNKAVIAPMLPTLARDARDQNWENYRRVYRQRFLLVLALTVLGCVAVVLGRGFLESIIGHGGVTRQNVNALWLLMVLLGGSFVGGSLVQLTAGAFYASGDTKTPTKISAIAYTIFVPLKVLAFLKYGVLGLAVSMSVYFVANLAVQLRTLRRKQRGAAKQHFHLSTEPALSFSQD